MNNKSTESSKKKIGIVGFGYVGQAMARFFEDRYGIVVYDPFWSEKKDGFEYRFPSYHITDADARDVMFDNCSLVVISVPTPMAKDGSCDTSAVKESLEWLGKGKLILIKSTVPPKFTQSYIDSGYNVAFSPEYLGESAYMTHYWKGYPDPTNLKTHEFQIFGGESHTTRKIIPFFRSIMGPETKYLQTDATTAEMAKYMENCFFATKVTFFNEFYEIAQRMDVDFNELRELFLCDGRINRNHTLVFEEKRGYGGKCYPKDMAGIIAASQAMGYDPKLLREVVDSNKFFNTRSQ